MTARVYHEIEDTVYFWFAANDTSGSGGDGATPLADVRLAGAAASAAPVLSPTPALLTDAGYPAGCYELAVAATVANGFAADSTYAVFCTLAIDSQNPTGFVGSFTLSPVLSNVQEWLDTAPSALVSGRVDSSVGAMAAGTVTATAIATDAIDADAIANSAIDSTTFATGAIDANAIAANAIGASELATNAIGQIQIAANAIDADAITLAAAQKTRGVGPTGVSDSGTASTIVDATAGGFGDSTTDDFWNGMVFMLLTGSQAGLSRLITNYDQASDTVTVTPAFPAAVGAGITYEIIPWGSVNLELWEEAVPNALVAGAVDADVSAMQADTITAAAIANAAIDAATFTAGAVDAAALAADAANEIADAVLSRDIDQVEATMALHSLGTAILKAVSRIRDNAGTLEIYRTNGTTLHMSQTVTSDASLDPVDELTAGV